MIPPKLQIGPYSYRVTTDLRELRQAETEERCFLHGRSDTGAQVIHLDPTAADDRVRVTLLHEVLHVLLNDLSMDKELEEVVVRVLANGLVDTFRRNPKLSPCLEDK